MKNRFLVLIYKNKTKKFMWTKNEEEILIEFYPDTDNRKLEEMLSKKRGCIVRKANFMGLKKSKDFITKQKKELNPKTHWSDYELDFLLNNYKTLSNSEISKSLSKTKKSVCRKLKELNIRRTKIEKDFITAKSCKLTGRDLNYEFVKLQALKFYSRFEFYLKDNGSYHAALKNDWLDDICSHMRTRKESLPQIILRDILEHILESKCSFNDRKVIYPKEIDCYFDKYRLGFEYDGRYYHDDIDHEKVKICSERGIKLIIIDEKNDNFRNYEVNIKSQLISNLDFINRLTGLNIIEKKISDYVPVIKYSDILYDDEIEFIKNKKLSEIKKLDKPLFNRLIKYKFDLKSLSVEDDRKKMKKFKSLEEYKSYLIENFNSFKHASKNDKHIKRRISRYNIDISEIKELWK